MSIPVGAPRKGHRINRMGCTAYKAEHAIPVMDEVDAMPAWQRALVHAHGLGVVRSALKRYSAKRYVVAYCISLQHIRHEKTFPGING